MLEMACESLSPMRTNAKDVSGEILEQAARSLLKVPSVNAGLFKFSKGDQVKAYC